MKNYINYILMLLSGLLISIPSCKEDTYVRPTIQNISTPISFSHSVLPVFTNHCALSGCHVTGGIAPDLTPLNAYNNLFLYALVDTTSPVVLANSALYEHITAAPGFSLMPPTGPLPEVYVDTIAAWITQGGPNN